MKLTEQMPLAFVAYHEAGHAAAHLMSGRPFRYVTIIPAAEALGQCVEFPPPPGFRPDIILTPEGERYLRDQIVCFFAGELSHRRHCGRRADRREIDVDHDRSNASNLATYVTGKSEAELNALLNWLGERAAARLSRPHVWGGVEAIASKLIHQRRLIYSDVRVAWLTGISTDIALRVEPVA